MSEQHSLNVTLDPASAKPRKRSLSIAGHSTSITLEDAFWDALKAIAAEKNTTVAALVAAVDAERGPASLSAALRVYVFNFVKRTF